MVIFGENVVRSAPERERERERDRNTDTETERHTQPYVEEISKYIPST